MKSVATHTLGCRLNQFETEKIAASLGEFRFTRTEFEDTADLYIINTCTVTHKADATCRQVISSVARRKGTAKLVVIGCYVEGAREKVASLPGVDLVVDNREKPRIRTILRQKWPEMFTVVSDTGRSNGVSEFYNHSRAWLKISDGCNQRCSFCIIPSVRGALRNNSAPNVIRDVQRLVDGGYHEIVLTGVHIGHFKDTVNGVADLPALIELILTETSISRIRLSSLEPQVVDEKIIGLFSEHTDRVCRHLHLPLQSGSNRILKSMRRPYMREQYLQSIRSLKREVPGVVIGGDVIVGFPGESDEDFQCTVEVADSGYMDYLHVFTYSDRRGTGASEMSGKCDPRITAERHTRLREISQTRMREAHRRESGNAVEAIPENLDPHTGRYFAVTDNYLKVLLPEGLGAQKTIYRASSVRIAESNEDYLIACAHEAASVA
ncbi:MAG: tRNA (N(6)-L-threonylcarbamoyladenosine(37)-C(2))-methylthiotransferase MtaB [Candidatus Zixiibacteriota bacterium]